MSDITAQGSDARQGQMNRAWNSYIGSPPRPLVPRVNEPDDNLIISLGRLVVDKGASFLFGKPVTFQIAGTGAEAKTAWLEECWRRNRRGILLLKAATNGGVFGHVFLRLLPPAPTSVGQPVSYPRIINLDPQTVEVTCDPDDCDTVWKFVITPPTQMDEDGGEIRRRTVIANPSGQAGERLLTPGPWQIVDQVMQGSVWVPVSTQIWPYPFCPIVHCQNLPRPNDFWGEADLPEDVLKILEAINRVASNYNKIIRIHAGPKVFSKGMGAQHIDISTDSIIHLPSEAAELRVLEMQSDLAGTLALLNKLLSLLSYMVRIPMVAMGEPDNLGSISGVALQIRYQPLVEKTESKRLTYGVLLQEADRCLLAMGNAAWGDANVTTLTWPELLPSDPLQERQVAVLDDSLRLVSRETLASNLGYDFDKEQEQIAAEHAADVAAGIVPQPQADVPPPQPLEGPMPDIAKTAVSR